MPKLKTHKATSKRISVTKTGKIQYRRTGGTHFLQKKRAARKRQLAGTKLMTGKQIKNIKRKLQV